MRFVNVALTFLLGTAAAQSSPNVQALKTVQSAPIVATQRVGQHPDFTRLVLDLPLEHPTYRVRETPTGLRLDFDVKLTESVLTLSSREVRASRLVPSERAAVGTTWQIDAALPVAGAYKVSVLPGASGLGARLVVDLGPALRATSPTCAPGAEALPAPTPQGLSGVLGLYVAVLDSVTGSPLRAVAHNPDVQFPLASAYKAPLVWAVLREVDAGRLRLGDRLVTDDANRSLGAFPRGANDVATLLRLTISRSDNTATDLLHRRIGLEKPQLLADELGLCRTRLLLPTKTWWTAQAGLSADFPARDLKNAAARFAAAPREEQLLLARSLDTAARSVKAGVLETSLDRYFHSATYAPEIDRDTQNASTPFEFATLLARAHVNSGLSPSSQAVLRDTLKLGCCDTRAFGPFSYFGGKGGSGWRILTMTGYLELPSGERVVYAFMQHGSAKTVTTLSDIPAAFRWINAAVARLVTPISARR